MVGQRGVGHLYLPALPTEVDAGGLLLLEEILDDADQVERVVGVALLDDLVEIVPLNLAALVAVEVVKVFEGHQGEQHHPEAEGVGCL